MTGCSCPPPLGARDEHGSDGAMGSWEAGGTVDGAGPLAIIRHVTLPQIRWQLSFVTLYQALSLLVSFEYIWLITDGGPFYDTTVYALYVYKRAFNWNTFDLGYPSAIAVLWSAMIIAFVLLMMRLFRQRERLEF